MHLHLPNWLMDWGEKHGQKYIFLVCFNMICKVACREINMNGKGHIMVPHNSRKIYF